MKKSLLLIAALLVLMLTACKAQPSASGDPVVSTPEQSSNETPADVPETPDEGENAPAAPETQDGQPDAGPQRREFSQPDAQGVITSVVGNELTIKLIEPLTGGIAIGGEGQPGVVVTFDPENLPEGVELPEGVDREAVRDAVRNFDPNNLPEGVTLPEGFDPNNIPDGATFRRGDGSTQSGRGGNFTNNVEMDVEYTGEEATITVPVGLTQTTFSKKQIVMVWYDENGEVENIRATGKAKNQE